MRLPCYVWESGIRLGVILSKDEKASRVETTKHQ